MKKIFFAILVLSAFSDIMLGQRMTWSAYVHGYWTDLWDNGDENRWYEYEWDMYGWPDSRAFKGFEFRNKFADPWNWCFKVYLDGDYLPIGKKAVKKFWKEHGELDWEDMGYWYECPGWVEYYVSDEYPTIEKILEEKRFPFIDQKTKTSGKIVKRTTKAVIKVGLYSGSYPRSFKIFFDGCGVRINQNQYY